jgi:mannitol/fructose-specific phosphotransferase system IIA component (Ntr-type)
MPPIDKPPTSPFWKLFKPKACGVQLKASTKESVLSEIVVNMVEGGALAGPLQAAGLDALLQREQLASTGVGMNVAIPHVKLEGIKQVAASLSVLAEGVEWSAVDGEPVRVLFTVIRPVHSGEFHDPDRHLEMMRWIARLGRDPDFRRFALQARTRTQLVDLLKEMAHI